MFDVCGGFGCGSIGEDGGGVVCYVAIMVR